MAYKVCLRNDGWFDSGRENSHPSIKNIYQSKQTLKHFLENLPPAETLSDLEKALGTLTKVPVGFESRPYLKGEQVRIVPREGLLEYCYLGEVVSD